MSKFEHSFLIVLILLNTAAVFTNYAIENNSAAIWAGISALWVFNYYMLKRKVS